MTLRKYVFHAPIIMDYMHICFLATTVIVLRKFRLWLFHWISKKIKKCLGHISSQKQKDYFRIIRFLTWQHNFLWHWKIMTSLSDNHGKVRHPYGETERVWVFTLTFCTVLVMMIIYPDEGNKKYKRSWVTQTQSESFA